jgi:hypothetical protein
MTCQSSGAIELNFKKTHMNGNDLMKSTKTTRTLLLNEKIHIHFCSIKRILTEL